PPSSPLLPYTTLFRSLGDASLLRDPRSLRHRQVVDVTRIVLDLLDLQRVDRETETLHLVGGRLTSGARQLVAVANQVLDGHRPEDRKSTRLNSSHRTI